MKREAYFSEITLSHSNIRIGLDDLCETVTIYNDGSSESVTLTTEEASELIDALELILDQGE